MNLFVFNDGAPNLFESLYSSSFAAHVNNAATGKQTSSSHKQNEKLAQDILQQSRECWEKGLSYRRKADALALVFGGAGGVAGAAAATIAAGEEWMNTGAAGGAALGILASRWAAKLIPSHHKDIYTKGTMLTVRGLPLYFLSPVSPSWNSVYKGILKTADLLSEKGISPRRALKGVVIIPSVLAGGAFFGTSDTVFLPFDNSTADTEKTLVHELIHRFEASPAGLYYRQLLTDKFWKDSAKDPIGEGHVYKTLRDAEATPYGTSDTRSGYPTEFSTTTIDGLLGTTLFPGTAEEYKRPYNKKAMKIMDDTFKQVAKLYQIAEPDFAKEALPYTSYDKKEINQSVTNTGKSIKRLVQCKQTLEDKLSLFQNIVLAHLAHNTGDKTNKHDKSDWAIVRRNYKKGKVDVPDELRNPDASDEVLESLVGRTIPRNSNVFEQRINRYDYRFPERLPPVTWTNFDNDPS